MEELEYRHFKVCGEFDHSKEMLLWPRSLRLEDGARGSPHGAQIITPFHCKDSRYCMLVVITQHDYIYCNSSTILINRGWVPSARMEADTRKEGQVDHMMSGDTLLYGV